MIRAFLPALLAAGLAGPAIAAPVMPTSYDMDNGNTGTYNYWDDLYDGAGNNQLDGAPLTGGLGDLTDGYVETAPWFTVEGPRGPNGPFVGWLRKNPLITFNFSQAYAFSSATFHFDNQSDGDVDAPSSISINGQNQTIPFQTPGGGYFSFSYDLTGQGPTDTLVAQIFGGQGPWIFLSEVTFEAADARVPLPAGVWLLGAALGGLGLLRRRG